MKTLILLLLLTVGAWGQEGYREGALLHYRSSTTTAWAIVDTNSVLNINIDFAREYAAVFLVAAWDAYAKECYADSSKQDRCGPMCRMIESDCTDSLHAIHDYGPVRVTLEYIDNVSYVPRFYYERRTPTYPGFIEYLRRQR